MAYDFSGWVTKANVECSDGRVIMRDAFKHMNGKKVPLVWGHIHDDPARVLGEVVLEHRDEGVYGYATFNNTESGQVAKELVKCGNVNALSIWANNLKEKLSHVVHGNIREVSLVLAGANPEAYIDKVLAHADESEDFAIVYSGDIIELCHSEEDDSKKGEEKMADDTKKTDSEKTVQEVFDTFTDEQKTVVYAMIGAALEGADSDDGKEDVKHSDYFEGGEDVMKYNVFEKQEVKQRGVLSHADQEAIVALAKQSSVGSFKQAMAIYAEEQGMLMHSDDGEDGVLAHGIFEDYEALFPEYEYLKKGEPETLERDQSWISYVLNKIHKSPISRIRTRQADARIDELRAHGYRRKGDEKKVSGNIKLLSRTTDPQTVYRKDAMHRDDITDITDFDVVAYQWGIMRRNLEEEIARAILIGDGREEGDEMKIYQEHIRSIWLDDDLYTIHYDIDVAAARAELQGTDTAVYFGDNFVYAEAIITAALYSREQYKGSGSLEFYCTPHLLNIMLLARDRNGHRMYASKSDLAAALNVTAIHTVEQFEGKTRTAADGSTKKLLGLFVNLNDYQVGATKGGEITKFDQFDIDFNQYKYLIETRISGALTRPYSAIALEEPVVAAGN